MGTLKLVKDDTELENGFLVQSTRIGNIHLSFSSDVYEDSGVLYDTKVFINNDFAIVIAGEQIINFKDELLALTEKYRI